MSSRLQYAKPSREGLAEDARKVGSLNTACATWNPILRPWISYFDGRFCFRPCTPSGNVRLDVASATAARSHFIYIRDTTLYLFIANNISGERKRGIAAKVKPGTRSIDIKRTVLSNINCQHSEDGHFYYAAPAVVFAWLLIFIEGGMQLYRSRTHTRARGSIKCWGPECHFSSKHTLTSLLGWISWRGR